MRNDFEPRVLSKSRVGEMLDAVLQNAEQSRLQHWLAAEMCADDEPKPSQDYVKADKEQARIEAAVVAWKAKHLGEAD